MPSPDALREILQLPRRLQPGALAAWRAVQPETEGLEAWNTRFGPGSLFDAWTRSRLMRGLYAANAAVLGPFLRARPGWTVVEVGGGDGSLWGHVLDADSRGRLVVVDPEPEVHSVVAQRLPPGVELHPVQRRVEDADLEDADAIVCSLTLHHVAGLDAGHRGRAGLGGPGKLEVLHRFRDAIRGRDGLVLLNEADIYCDLDLLPGDPLLVDRLLDSYVRRCAVALFDDIATQPDTDLARRWWALVLHWCVDQVQQASVPIADRDVYELDVPSWLRLIGRAGLRVDSRRFTDDYGLFHQYLIR